MNNNIVINLWDIRIHPDLSFIFSAIALRYNRSRFNPPLKFILEAILKEKIVHETSTQKHC